VARPCRIPTGFRRTVVDIGQTVPRDTGMAKTASTWRDLPLHARRTIPWRPGQP